MREKRYNPQTGNYEWVYVGQSHSGNGTSDFHRHQRVLDIKREGFTKGCEFIEKRIEKMSNYKKGRYLRGVRIRQDKVKNLNELKRKKEKPQLMSGRYVENVYESQYLHKEKEEKNKFDKYM